MWWPTSIGELDAVVGEVAWWCDPKYGELFVFIALLPVNGDLLCCEWCSDLIERGVCVLCEWLSPKRDGGVCVPPVITLDEVDSSPSLSYVCVGDFSPRLPCIYGETFFSYLLRQLECFVVFINGLTRKKELTLQIFFFLISLNFITYLHMLSQRWRMSIRFITAVHSAIVWFVGCMHMGVFLSIRWVGKSSITSFVFTFKRLFTWKWNLFILEKRNYKSIMFTVGLVKMFGVEEKKCKFSFSFYDFIVMFMESNAFLRINIIFTVRRLTFRFWK